MQVHVIQQEGARLAIQSRTHTILCDQPQENGGSDSGMTPLELLLAALGSCAAFYAAQYLRTRDLASSGVEVFVTAEKLQRPTRLGNFRVHVTCPVPLSDEQRVGLTRSVEHCTVHHTLMMGSEIAIDLEVKKLATAEG